MFAKSLLAAAAVASTVALGTASSAKADPHISIGLGFGFGGYVPGYYDSGFGEPDPYWGGPHWDGPFHRHHFHDHGWDRPVVSYGLSCGAAGNVLRAAGFHGVQAVDCARPVYGYEAWKRGELFRVSVNTAGRIVEVSPIY